MTKISANYDGVQFTVDGTTYTRPVTMFWPAGSKHTLAASPLPQSGSMNGTQYTFAQWSWVGGVLPGNPVTITADPAIAEYKVTFNLQYALNVLFYSCADPCNNGPGTVSINGVPYTSSQTLYFGANSAVILQAYPNPGFVFGGWSSAASQTILGFQSTLILSEPRTVTVLFQVARQIQLATSPPGLQVLADRATVLTPVALDWGWDSVHTVGPISPQRDSQNNYWVFSSWSDGGAANHAYTVAKSLTPDVLTANFVPGVAVSVETSPSGLTKVVDGRSNWPSYYFTWGVGEVHNLQAPAQQTDAQNRVWGFSGWSNGGSATQDFTVPVDGVAMGVRLVATYTPVGHLTVSSSLAGVGLMVNGKACSAPCDLKQPVGTQVTVSAPASVAAGPGSRQDLLGWSNGAGPGDLTLTLGAEPIAVSANYHLMNYLSASSSPSGGVSWSMQPVSSDGYYDAQSTVSVSVTPLSGYRFRNWTGDLSGSALAGSLTMGQPRTVQAVLDKVPYLASDAVTNGAGTTPVAGVAPGSVISIFGANLAAGTVVGPASPMAQTLGGVTVQLGGRFLPLFFVSPAQVNAQLPADTAVGDATLTLSSEGQPDVETKFTVVADAPGLFAQVVDGQSFALAYHADGSSVTTASPARVGEVVTVYGTGFGPTSVPRPIGMAVPATPVPIVTDPVSGQLGGIVPVIQNAFAVSGAVGVDAVQLLVGDGAGSGTNAPLNLTVNGRVSNTVLLPLQ